MDFTAALPPFVITLREGVEAALVVGIVLACLQKAQRSQLNRWVYLGIVVGLVGSGFVGLGLTAGLSQLQMALPGLQTLIKPALESLFCAIAIAMLSWMLLWMTRQARSLKADIEDSITAALAHSNAAGWSIFTLIAIAVLREGFETVLFLFTQLQPGITPIAGAVAGGLGAIAIGFALFGLGVRINLKRFFQVMGILLLLIVGALVVSMLKNLNAAIAALAQLNNGVNLCFSSQSCILGPQLWDAHNILPDKQFPGVILKTLLGYRDRLYLGQLLGYGLFLATIGGAYFRSLGLAQRTQAKAQGANPEQLTT
ncbi:MAG: FTR1 family protein [Cyanobacteria bacterium J06635_15]